MPNLYRTNGYGMNSNDKHPSNVQAQPTPRLRNIWVAKRGKAPPKDDRKKSFPARTEAAYFGYALAS